MNESKTPEPSQGRPIELSEINLTPAQKMEALYNAEINFSISCFWDGGFTIKIGDESNGFKDADVCVYGFENACNQLWEMAKKAYPGDTALLHPNANLWTPRRKSEAPHAR